MRKSLLRVDQARHRHEQALTQSESQYRQAEQIGHIGHWRIEYPSGTVTWSDEFQAICGLSRAAPTSLEMLLELSHPDDEAVAREVLAQARRGGRGWEIAYRIRRPNGEVRHIKSHGVCDRDDRGDLVAIFGVIVDVTELEQSRREAEAASASKAAFLANMSHEIRTPMNGVMGFVELLMDSNLDAQQRRHLMLIQESAQTLLKLLNDILDLSKIEAGQLEVSPEASDVRRDVAQCVRLMTPIALQKGLDLIAVIDADFPARIMVDSLRLRQIIFNLIGNAIKFTNRGSVKVTLGTRIDGTSGHDLMLIGVKDTGVGIDPKRLTAIFDAFVQADASISRRFGGSGLGLSISRRLARLMDGSIALESEEGEGTLVTVAIPLTPAQAPAEVGGRPVAGAQAMALAAAPGICASILLVEDIDINQELVTEMLTRLGHKVEVAGNGAEALEQARRLEREPGAWDLILMDVQMPVMDGLTATRAIRALGGRAATIPIIALTANAFAEEIKECRDAGMNDHVAKPRGSAQLKRVIERWAGAVAPSDASPDLANPVTPSLADRFEARRRNSGLRLTRVIAELNDADPQAATILLNEVKDIAHIFAGTAELFAQIELSKVARQVETELKSISRAGANGTANPAIARLITALGASA